MLELNYELSELPSSQHRAGLAGLVIFLQWLDKQPGKRKGKTEITRLDETGATFKIDQKGLRELFDKVYAASTEEIASSTLRKDKKKEVVEPLRTEEKEIKDKSGEKKKKTYYFYPTTVPHGAFLVENDPSLEGKSGLWIKLWRDAVWSVLRGVPAQRNPYEARAEKNDTTDAEGCWKSLCSPDKSSDPRSTYFLGAQKHTADNVPMRDRNKFLFLLHFWPFISSVYIPNKLDNEGNRTFDGYALAIPDICNLEDFCLLYLGFLKERSKEKLSYRPKSCVVDIAEEVGLDALHQLRERLREKNSSEIRNLVLGIDIFHLSKDGNNVRLLANTRIEPGSIVNEYTRIRSAYKDTRFRKVRLKALLSQSPWYAGFERVLCTTDYKQTFGRAFFRKDARRAFELETKGMEPTEIEPLVYRVVGQYLASKLKSKHDLDWKSVKDKNDEEQSKFNEKRHKIAKDAFLAIRSRTQTDFVEYFTGTICSVPHRLNEDLFLSLTRALLNEPDKVRTLTLLALSARS